MGTCSVSSQSPVSALLDYPHRMLARHQWLGICDHASVIIACMSHNHRSCITLNCFVLCRYGDLICSYWNQISFLMWPNMPVDVFQSSGMLELLITTHVSWWHGTFHPSVRIWINKTFGYVKYFGLHTALWILWSVNRLSRVWHDCCVMGNLYFNP